ncbi:MAG: hypothetical protein RLZZ253_1642 [Verrucomicrobiota bacterium]|jgi:hypothetical protein
MLKRTFTTLAALAIAGASASSAYGSEEALLKLLVSRGLIKKSDADSILAETSKPAKSGKSVVDAKGATVTSVAPSKLKLSDSIEQLKIYGDLRLRWQHANADLDGAGNNFQDQSFRFRLLLGAEVTLAEDLFAGFEFSTGSSPTDRFVTLGQDADGSGDYKVAISKAYVGWNPIPEISLVGGRQAVPFYSTELVWDNDVRLDGVTEKVDLAKLMNLGGGFGLDLIAGQFISGNNQSFESSAVLGRSQNTDAWLYQAQVKASANVGPAKVTVAPGVLWANGAFSSNNPRKGALGLGGSALAATADVANDVGALLLPGDVSFDLAGAPVKLLWDFAYNFEASTATDRLVATTSGNEDRLAYLVGFKIGDNVTKGDLSFYANYRHLGAGSVNQGFSDSDFGLGFLNQRGFQVGTCYNLTNAASVSLAYSATRQIDQDLTLLPSGGVNATQLATIQLGVEF